MSSQTDWHLLEVIWSLWKGLISDLHPYRGHQQFNEPFVSGHEFIGHVVGLGKSFAPEAPSNRPQLYRTLKIGDKVVAPFTVSCQECEFCAVGFSSRCTSTHLFGTSDLPGAQSQFIRVPKAGGTLIKLDDISSSSPGADNFVPNECLLLLADILPTGFHALSSALRHPNLKHWMDPTASSQTPRMLNLAIVGLGPVGLCTLISAVDFMRQAPPQLKVEISGIDPNDERRDKARRMAESCLAATPGQPNLTLEFATPEESLEISRKKGGVHTAASFPIKPFQLYSKNVAMSFGRCPARSLFDEAFGILKRNQNVLGIGTLVDTVIRISPEESLEEGDRKVKEAYRKFDEGACGKVLFDFW
ncbi:hypothetical protein FRC02_000241 [Tulasnella sp. 418]|nr:hypothetical protein FRC02_000241 [Tulasnella sp. 418]